MKKLLLTFRIAIRALAKNKMRAGLTIIGVVIGIAAVTCMVSLGQSATQLIQNEFQSFGTNLIIVFPESHRRRGVRSGVQATLTSDDCDAIARECVAVRAVTPIVPSGGQVVYGNVNWSPSSMEGVGPGFIQVRNWEVSRGGFFTERDIAAAAQVCVIGTKISRELFQTANPLGETIRVRNVPFEIIGVLEEKGANMSGENQDDIVLMPYTTVTQRLYRAKLRNIPFALVSANSPDSMNKATEEVRQLLMERHQIAPGNPADFRVQSTTEMLKSFTMVTSVLTGLLASIAGISLLVGGVGIMNIMLVSVTERTREIGVRMAVGASSFDILMQFLVESIVLSIIGGLLGFSFGVAASIGATKLLNSWIESAQLPITVSIWAGLLAVGFSAVVGMFFGFYPALRASLLDPIDALRYE